jgi:hypothetical protein
MAAIRRPDHYFAMSVVFIFSVKKGLDADTCIIVSEFHGLINPLFPSWTATLPHGITPGNATITPLYEESSIILMPERQEHLSDELVRHFVIFKALHQQYLLLPVIGYFGGEPDQGLLAEKWCLREQGLHLFPRASSGY